MKQNYLRRTLSATILFLASTLTWAQDLKVDGIDYKINPDGVSVYVWRYDYFNDNDNYNRNHIVIPSKVTNPNNGRTYSVTGIGGSAFSETWIRSIEIPNSVTSIGDYAFLGCMFLSSVNIPDGVTNIGKSAFNSCDSLTSINIPASVKSIGDGAFSACYSIESISVSEDNLDYDSRKGCNAIIETATNKLISGCKNTTIPDGVSSIGDYAFNYCLFLESINIPDGVTSIGKEAFYNCNSLTSIDIPGSVTSIGNSAFYYCSSITTVICRAKSVPKLGNNYVFYYAPISEATLYVPASALDAYKAADQWKNFGTILPLAEVNYIQKAEWNTIVLPFDTDLEPFGTGAKAYAFTGAKDGMLSFSTVDHLEANTPYIIYATEAKELTFDLTKSDVTIDDNTSVEHNGVTFRGTYEDIDAPGMQGKYGIADDARIRRGSELAYIKAYHAYFEAAAGAEVKAISFDGDDATDIAEIADALQQDAQYYNLAGQRTQKPQKGVNIVNGKKVLY